MSNSHDIGYSWLCAGDFILGRTRYLNPHMHLFAIPFFVGHSS